MTATDTELRRDVEQELEWEPAADERNLGVNVARGVVTLSGDVNSYIDKWNAERAVERVRGVRGIANEIRVLPVGSAATVRSRRRRSTCCAGTRSSLRGSPSGSRTAG